MSRVLPRARLILSKVLEKKLMSGQYGTGRSRVREAADDLPVPRTMLRLHSVRPPCRFVSACCSFSTASSTPLMNEGLLLGGELLGQLDRLVDGDLGRGAAAGHFPDGQADQRRDPRPAGGAAATAGRSARPRRRSPPAASRRPPPSPAPRGGRPRRRRRPRRRCRAMSGSSAPLASQTNSTCIANSLVFRFFNIARKYRSLRDRCQLPRAGHPRRGRQERQLV